MKPIVFVALVIAGASLAAAQRPSELVLDDHAGFEAIFDGSSLKGWATNFSAVSSGCRQ